LIKHFAEALDAECAKIFFDNLPTLEAEFSILSQKNGYAVVKGGHHCGNVEPNAMFHSLMAGEISGNHSADNLHRFDVGLLQFAIEIAV